MEVTKSVKQEILVVILEAYDFSRGRFTNKFSYLKQNAQNISQSQNIENAVDILTKISEKLI